MKRPKIDDYKEIYGAVIPETYQDAFEALEKYCEELEKQLDFNIVLNGDKAAKIVNLKKENEELKGLLSEYVFNKRSIPDDPAHTAKCIEALKQK
jgi:hypothetical protein